MAAWFLAASPIKRSFSLKETNDGVVKLPCSLAMISTLFPSYVATQEYVVPMEQQKSVSMVQIRGVNRMHALSQHTQIDANGTIVNFFSHFCYFSGG
jgi:hypothetical protein